MATFKVCSGMSYTLNEIINKIQKVADKESIIEYTPARNFNAHEIRLDISKTKKGLSHQYEWMTDFLDISNS